VHDLIPRSVAESSQRYVESWAMTTLILCKYLLSTYDTMDTRKRETSESVFILALPCNVGFSGACKRARMADKESTWNDAADIAQIEVCITKTAIFVIDQGSLAFI
jgi:hypothetical protein